MFTLSSRNVIPVNGGDVFHFLKASDPEFKSFGEAYFSKVEPGFVKGWKRHTKMHMNLICISGSVLFVFYDCNQPITQQKPTEVILSSENNQLLSVPPSPWFAFKGLGDSTSILCNISSIVHDENEVVRASISSFPPIL